MWHSVWISREYRDLTVPVHPAHAYAHALAISVAARGTLEQYVAVTRGITSGLPIDT